MSKSNKLKISISVCLCAIAAIVTAFLLCGGSNYTNAIPSNATALARIDLSKAEDGGAVSAIKSLLGVDNLEGCGLDATSSLYLFETVDGNFGLCGKVSDIDKLKNFFSSQSSKGFCSEVKKTGDYYFTDIKGSWCVGYSSNSLVVLGPVTAAAMPDAKRVVMRLLGQKKDRSVVKKPIFAKLSSMESPFAFVAQAQALPEKIAGPLFIGAPKGADVSQLLVAANVYFHKQHVLIEGTPFSFDEQLQKSLDEAGKAYRKIGDSYFPLVSKDDAFAMFLNVKGEEFLPLLQSNPSFQAMLAGANMAIDLDNILRSVDGDLFFAADGFTDKRAGYSIFAKVVDSPKWLKDIDYWKSSCQKGCSISDDGDKAWIYRSGDANFSFGLKTNDFYATNSPSKLACLADKSSKPSLSSDITGEIRNSRLAVVVNPSAIAGTNDVAASISNAFGGMKTIVYVMKFK